MGEPAHDDLRRPPLAIWAQVIFVTAAAAVLVRDPSDAGLWPLLAVVAFIQYQLLKGSLFAWWVEAVGVAGALLGYFGAQERIESTEVDLSSFLDPARMTLAVSLLVCAAGALLLPAARAYAKRMANFELTRGGTIMFALGVAFVASVPVEVLSAEERLPSEAMFDEAEGATFIGGSEREAVAFYAKETRDQVCLIHVARNASGSSCDDLLSHDPPNTGTSGKVFSGIVSKDVARVQIVVGSEPPRDAVVVDDPRFDANFFYLVDDLDPALGAVFVGYDADGNEAFRRRH